MWAPIGIRDVEIKAICFQVAGKHWLLRHKAGQEERGEILLENSSMR